MKKKKKKKNFFYEKQLHALSQHPPDQIRQRPGPHLVNQLLLCQPGQRAVGKGGGGGVAGNQLGPVEEERAIDSSWPTHPAGRRGVQVPRGGVADKVGL
jgi:hypothetical protein